MSELVVPVRTTCRVCQEGIDPVLALGTLRLNAFPSGPWEIDAIPRVPLALMVCTGCGLVQLDRTVPADLMFRTYWYRSGVNETMRAELQMIVEEASQLVALRAGQAVLDIGANDGTLLSNYPSDIYRVAVDPALNLADQCTQHCDVHFNTYFPDPAIVSQFTIITAVACSYDLEDPVAFFRAIYDRLAPGGVAVVQFQDFGQQIETAAFDNIVHEHLEYYTAWSLMHLGERAGLTLQRIVVTPINGGSLRVFLRRREDRIPAEASVGYQLVKESQQKLDTPTIRDGNREAFQTFARRVERAKVQIAAALELAAEQGCVVDVLGASTKGNVLLQILGIGPGQVRRAIDRDPRKSGCFTITGIPIVGEDQRAIEPADLCLCNIWQFKAGILEREREYLERGGSILFPLPYTEIVKADWLVRE